MRKELMIQLLFTLLLIGVAVAYLKKSEQKVGVIKLHMVFEKFHGSKVAADELMSRTKKYETSIDSLKNRITFLSAQEGNEEQIQHMQRVIYQLGQQGEMAYRKINDELSVGIQNKIDTYLEMFREEKGYDVLIGQYNSTGAIAVDESVDVTTAFIEGLNTYYFNGTK